MTPTPDPLLQALDLLDTYLTGDRTLKDLAADGQLRDTLADLPRADREVVLTTLALLTQGAPDDEAVDDQPDAQNEFIARAQEQT